MTRIVLSLLLCVGVLPPSVLRAEVDGRSLALIGYLPQYRVAGAESDQLAGLSELIYFSIEPAEDGRLPEQPIPQETLETLDRLRESIGCRILVSIGGWGRSSHFPALAANGEARKRFVESLASFCRTNRFAGVDYDWEHPKDESEIEAFTKLVAETRAKFDRHGLVVTVAQASWQDLGKPIYAAVHRVHLMSYDHDFPQATFEKSMADVEALLKSGCPAHKIALGVPFYGRDKKRNSLAYRELVAEGPFDPEEDERGGYAFNGRETIMRKMDYALEKKLGGIMVWEVGQDAKDPSRSLLSGMKAHLATVRRESEEADQAGGEKPGTDPGSEESQ